MDPESRSTRSRRARLHDRIARSALSSQDRGANCVRSLPAERIAALADPGTVASVDDALAGAAAFVASRAVENRGAGRRWRRACARRRSSARRCSSPRRTSASSAAVRAPIMPMRCAACSSARARRGPLPCILLVASGGVRLYEANPAEFALARALAALLDLRAAGVRVLALGVGDVFGGSSVLACAADRIALLPGDEARSFGTEGDRDGARARRDRRRRRGSGRSAVRRRSARGGRRGRPRRRRRDVVRAWIASAMRDDCDSFAERVHATQVRLATRLFGRDVRRADAPMRGALRRPLRRGCSPTREPVAPDARSGR